MNNGKVRIYELSKELDLDNKDILAVCADLNISVKSHSSTITENEAERIRAAAPKYSSSHSSLHRPTSPSHGNSSLPKESVSQPVVKKQEIIALHRNPVPSVAPVSPPQNPAPELEKSPEPEATSANSAPKPAAPVKTGSPQRPVRSTASTAPPTAPVVEALPPVEGDSEATSTEKPQEERSPAPRVEATASKPPSPATPAAPPVRPARESSPAVRANNGAPNEAPRTNNMVNRPVLKLKDRSEGASASTPRPAQPRPATNGSSGGISERPQPRRSESGPGQIPGRPQTVIELRRPPARPGLKTATDEASDETPALITPPAFPGTDDDRRPSPPRLPSKRVATGRRNDEEDDELQEQPKAKVGPKNKRRNQPLLDEDLLDEDLLDEDGDNPEPAMQVSLSLARPAKPKAPRAAQPKPTTVAAPKSKKSGSDGSSSRNRRERREEVKAERPTKIILTGSLTVQELASILAIPETDIIRALFFKGIAANINQTLDISTATTLAQEFEVEVETAQKASEARKVTEMIDAGDLEKLQRRPPVVTIMGHVDHGKTTLLDSIRKSKVAQGEAGGITQHIGAYHVDVEHEGTTQQVVFLDTPGHQAFTAMRARGARVTDVAILVVAADDGVQPQTIEAISHAKAAEVPIVVAINKIDKEGAQPDRVKQELTEFGLLAEEWGGDTIMVPVSAMNGENLDTLLEMILLVSEVEDLYANPDRPAKGTVIEAHLDKARGPVATLLVQNGTLRVGDTLVAGSALGKVRAMIDDRGAKVDIASPSFAVEVLGLGDVPAAGDDFEVFQDEREARSTATARADQQRQSRLQQRAMSARQVSLNSISARAQEGDLKELNLILKADVQGSVEAILGALQQLPQNEVQIRVLLSAPGEITETDVDLAAASAAVILGFNTTLAPGARQAADQAGVDVRDYNIIYKLLDDIQGAMEGLLDPEQVEEPLGQVEVRAVFPVGRGSVAGCYVLSGKAIRNCNVRVRRGGNVIHEGILDSLKRMKEDAREVNAGYECGVGLSNFNSWVEGDIIETFRMVSKRRSLSAS